MIKEIKKGDRFFCIKDYKKLYKSGKIYSSLHNCCITDDNENELSMWGTKEKLEIVNDYFNLIEPHTVKADINLPEYYNNENGSLYKVATERNWNAYLFDVCKRLERGGKKDPLKQEIEKSIGVLQLWLKEIDNENK